MLPYSSADKLVDAPFRNAGVSFWYDSARNSVFDREGCHAFEEELSALGIVLYVPCHGVLDNQSPAEASGPPTAKTLVVFYLILAEAISWID